MITIANKTDWNIIRAEYIAGGISQRKLAKKHCVPFPTLRDRAASEGWTEKRSKARDKVVADAVQKTSDAVADNATKLERAKGLAIDRIIKALEEMPDTAATNVRRYTQKDGKRETVEYNLLELVTALEKMTRGEDKPATESVKVIIDV